MKIKTVIMGGLLLFSAPVMQAQVVEPSGVRRFKELEKAAESGHIRSMEAVALAYYKGAQGVLLVRRNSTAAVTWLKRAADSGSRKAEVLELLALSYEHGLGTAQDYAEAEKWFQAAIAAGSKTAAPLLKMAQENKPRVAAARAALAAEKPPAPPFPSRDEKGRYGAKEEPGKMTILAGYDDARPFREGLAAVRRNGKWGYVDRSGKEVISPVYDVAQPFSDGMAAVGIGLHKAMGFAGKWGFVDKEGSAVVPIKYDDVAWFSEGLAAVRLSDKWGFIDTRGIVVIPLVYDVPADSTHLFHQGVVPVMKNNKVILIDKAGREVAAAK